VGTLKDRDLEDENIMAVTWRQPILVGGVGLSFLLWLANSWNPLGNGFGETTLLALMATGGVAWWWRRSSQPSQTIASPQQSVDLAKAEQAIDGCRQTISQLQAELPTETDSQLQSRVANLQQKVESLPQQLQRQDISIGVTGGQGTGKTTLAQVLSSSATNGDIPVCYQDTTPWFASEAAEWEAKQQLYNCDLVLFLTSGDITDSEYQAIREIAIAPQRVLVVWNQQYPQPKTTVDTIRAKLQQRLTGIVPAEDIVAIAAAGREITVRQTQADGSVVTKTETTTPHLEPLQQRLQQILHSDTIPSLLYTSTYRQAIATQQEIQNLLNQLRRDRAFPQIERYQWIAAAAAFANPIPSGDILATIAVNTQMVMDLSKIYQQPFSWSQAQEIAKTLGAVIVKLGLVELSTKTLTTILKTNVTTYVAGSAIEGVSAAYITRIAGLGLIDYFQEQPAITQPSQIDWQSMKQKLQAAFQRTQQNEFLVSFAKKAANRLPIAG
jgi:hypothetical protein